MKLKVVVTDANIFIDLNDLELTEAFFKLNIEVHTTSFVIHELYREQQRLLRSFQKSKKLSVHNLQEKDFREIHNTNYPKSLSIADKSVLHLAYQMKA